MSTHGKRNLRPHQMRALGMLRESLASGKRTPLLQAPTGFGKTLVATTIIRGYTTVPAKCGAKRRVILTVPAIELIDQTYRMLWDEGIRDIGVLQGNHEMTNTSAQVQIASVQTLRNRRIPAAQCVLIDEAHRWFDFYGQWMADPSWRNTKFIGLSATPWTKGLANHFDDLLIPTTTQELIDTIDPETGRPYLTPFRVYAPSHPDLSKVGMVGDDYNAKQLGAAMNQPKLVADVVATWQALAKGRTTLCFAVNRAHGQALWAQFRKAGVKVAYVDGDVAFTDDSERPVSRERIRLLSELGQIEVVVNIGVLTTGCDWPFVSCIVLARPTKSEMLYVQIVGRGLRSNPDKLDCLVLDHSDTTERLGFVTDIHHDHLDDGKLRRCKPKPEDEKPMPKVCPSCATVKPPKTPICPTCGFHAKVQSSVRSATGELVEVGSKKAKKPVYTTEQKQLWYSMLLGHAFAKHMKKGWAYHKYREKFGVGPGNQIREIAMEPNAEVASWIRSRQIAWANSKQRGEARP